MSAVTIVTASKWGEVPAIPRNRDFVMWIAFVLKFKNNALYFTARFEEINIIEYNLIAIKLNYNTASFQVLII